MSNWQELAVAFLLLLCLIRIGMSLYSFFRRSEQNENPCAGCATGCDLKRLLDEKRGECEVERKKKKKSCCG
ncbi:hypothetical protein [Bacteroides heparinolyticus]|uniref:hypothetical protein n=1 Tax=Prevotella heparinolytica TaxID=28113 RepID=UPI0035A1D03B